MWKRKNKGVERNTSTRLHTKRFNFRRREGSWFLFLFCSLFFRYFFVIKAKTGMERCRITLLHNGIQFENIKTHSHIIVVFFPFFFLLNRGIYLYITYNTVSYVFLQNIYKRKTKICQTRVEWKVLQYQYQYHTNIQFINVHMVGIL